MTGKEKNDFIHEIEELHARHELAASVNADYFAPGMMEYPEQSDGVYDDSLGNFSIRFEVKGTRYDGRTELIENVRVGEPITVIRENGNTYNSNNFTLLTADGKNVGNMPAQLCNVLAPLYDRGELQISAAIVSFVEPISRRSRYAKQAILFVEVSGKCEGMIEDGVSLLNQRVKTSWGDGVVTESVDSNISVKIDDGRIQTYKFPDALLPNSNGKCELSCEDISINESVGRVKHKVCGTGKIVCWDWYGNKVYVDFETGINRTFRLPKVFEDGFLEFEDRTVQRAFSSYLETCKESKDCLKIDKGGEFVLEYRIIEGEQEISDSDLEDCFNVVKIFIPKSVKTISREAFECCRKLEYIEVDTENENFKSINGILYSHDKDTILHCPPQKAGKIVIPDTVRCIGYHAFANCSKVTEVIIPQQVTTIREGAFLCCNEIRRIDIPENTSIIESFAFSGCKCLSVISVDYNNQYYCIDDGILFSKDLKELLSCPGSRKKEVYIPNKTLIIQNGAFEGCAKISFVTFNGNNLNEIGYSAFAECKEIISMRLPEGLKKVGNRAFEGCSKLKKIFIPASLERLGVELDDEDCWSGIFRVFDGCCNVEELIVDSNNKNYISRDNALYSSFYSIYYDCYFYHMLFCSPKHKGKLSLPNGLIVTDNYLDMAILDNGSLITEIEIPDWVYNCEEIEDYGFCGGKIFNENLERITVSENNDELYSDSGILYYHDVKPDGTYFYYDLLRCPKKKKGDVKIPEGVETIRDYSFSGCKAITSVSLPSTLKEIWNQAFYDTSLREINIPENVKDIYISREERCFSGKDLERINISTSNKSGWSSQEGIIYRDNEEILSLCPSGRKGKLTIQEGVKKIDDFAFYDCYRIEEIILPQSLLEIGETAFGKCKKLHALYIPSEVCNIDPFAFNNSEGLAYIEVDPNNKTYYSKDGAIYERGTDDCLFTPPIDEWNDDSNNCEQLKIIELFLHGKLKDLFEKYGVDESKEGVLAKNNIYYEISKEPDGPFKELLKKLARLGEMKADTK